jgi:hypothetical protein
MKKLLRDGNLFEFLREIINYDVYTFLKNCKEKPKL